MRVLLLNPVTRTGLRSLRVGRCQGKVMVGFWPNIEYGYLGQMLRRESHQVHLLDANADGLSYQQMVAAATQYAPDVVFLLSITATLLDDLHLGEDLRIRMPRSVVVYWGTHATVRPDDYLQQPGAVVIRGEVELPGVEVCRALSGEANLDGALAGIGSVSFHGRNGVVHSEARPLLQDLDSLPHPAHDLMGVGKYLATDIHRPFALIKTSRGCPHRCVFCTAQTFHGNRWRHRSPLDIVDEIEGVVRHFGIRDFFFQSDVFSQSHQWTQQLCEELLHRDLRIQWFANSRVDSHTPETLKLMKASGARLLAFGVESGSDTVLAAIGKGATTQQAAHTLEACRTVGIPTLTYWVFGLPGETAATMQETLRFVRKTHPDYAHFYAPTPLPGSRLYQQLGIAQQVESGQLQWSHFFQGVSRQFVAGEVSVEQVRTALRTAYLQFYSDPRRIAHELRLALGDWNQFKGRATTFATMVRNYVLTD